jgi:GH24 family phage-related lysozyme (muramidase)
VSTASEITADRIIASNSEGFRPDVYDDATGKLIVCDGQPTVGYGCRVRQWSKALARQVLIFQLAEFEAPLLQLPWYLGCNDARRSGLLEIAFNQGEQGLAKGYPHLIAAVVREDWAEAEAQCSVEDARLKPRYAVIGKILFTGVA